MEASSLLKVDFKNTEALGNHFVLSISDREIKNENNEIEMKPVFSIVYKEGVTYNSGGEDFYSALHTMVETFTIQGFKVLIETEGFSIKLIAFSSISARITKETANNLAIILQKALESPDVYFEGTDMEGVKDATGNA